MINEDYFVIAAKTGTRHCVQGMIWQSVSCLDLAFNVIWKWRCECHWHTTTLCSIGSGSVEGGGGGLYSDNRSGSDFNITNVLLWEPKMFKSLVRTFCVRETLVKEKVNWLVPKKSPKFLYHWTKIQCSVVMLFMHLGKRLYMYSILAMMWRNFIYFHGINPKGCKVISCIS